MPPARGTKSKAKTPAKKNGGPKTATVVPEEQPAPVTEPVIDESGAVDILMSDRAILEPIYVEVDLKSQELVQVSQRIQQLEIALVEGGGNQQQISGNLEGFNTILTGMLSRICKDYGLVPEEYRIDRSTWKLVKRDQ